SPVRRPRQTETTALGAAFLAGLGAGVWTDRDLARLWKLDRELEPVMSRDQADDLQARWRQAVDRSLHWALPDQQLFLLSTAAPSCPSRHQNLFAHHLRMHQ